MYIYMYIYTHIYSCIGHPAIFYTSFKGEIHVMTKHSLLMDFWTQVQPCVCTC